MKPTLHLLSGEEREAIAEAAHNLLDRIGVRLTEPEARELLRRAGARIEGDRVFIPPHLIVQAVECAPSAISIFARHGGEAMRLEGRNIYYGAHTDAPDVLDPFTRERRPCLKQDVIGNAVLADSLPNIHFITASGLTADCPPEIADRVSLAQCLQHSTKPVLTMPISLDSLRDMREMAALAVGGDSALRARSNVIVYAEPVSPLLHPDESIGKLLYCAEHGLPVAYVPYAAMGGTAPQSQAAIIAQLCAESLSALVVHQLKRPGAPFIFGGMASVMDMKTTVFSYGAPEFQLGNSLMAEMAHYFELPNFGTGGTSDSQTFDGQAILEAASSCMMASLVGANLIHDVGLLGSATVVMPEMIAATDEIAAMLSHLFGAVAVDADSLSLNLFAGVETRGEFVTHPYTLEHMRDVWYSQLLYRGGDKEWADSERLAFESRVNTRTRALIEQHQPPLLPADTAECIERIALRGALRERFLNPNPAQELAFEPLRPQSSQRFLWVFSVFSVNSVVKSLVADSHFCNSSVGLSMYQNFEVRLSAWKISSTCATVRPR
ncbi:MAG: hypothetical protein FJ030_05260 [Chloroflexi bacterium]|nr:hypothetical protein [Chloroflexota bacterium]